ncbi:MAG TPA: class I SAM-dependent methyltransferase [Jatrophihabitans sp.]|jgi:ubiquinone/menaquinone biosynthesis C-methylase UbiE|nr:class I SAM-dependent methyltransferase [Jatrophihabitans sp.]
MPDHHRDHRIAAGADDAALAELLDLDGEVLHSYWTDALSSLHPAATGAGRILDLGAGTGVATIALAQRFDGAEVIAVDASEEMLRRVRVKALELGLADRVRTVQADLDLDWPALGPIDVTWASMSLHHLADPDRVLRDVFAATRAGGLAAVAELSEPLSFLPHDVGVGRPGLEARCLDALNQAQAHALPELGSAWSPRLEAAGFTVVSEQALTIELKPRRSPGAVRYAQLWLRRLRSGLTHQLADDDLEALSTLVDGDGPESLVQRDDLHIRGTRIVTLARRP